MTRSTPTRRRSPARKTPIGPRAVILAGIGAVSLGRKQAQAKLGQAETAVRKTRAQAETFVRQARTQVETALAPVLVKLGVKRAPAKRKARAKRATTRSRKRA
jgi:F0F1-type ATP synthase membrane subunit b/b'